MKILVSIALCLAFASAVHAQITPPPSGGGGETAHAVGNVFYS
jgi:hypothetical protein